MCCFFKKGRETSVIEFSQGARSVMHNGVALANLLTGEFYLFIYLVVIVVVVCVAS
jgi:hypothetical protein